MEPLPLRVLLSATPTSVVVTASVSSAVYGQAVNLTAHVSASPSPPSEGYVAFFDNGALLSAAAVTSGAATLDNVELPAGPHSITAAYSDATGNFAPSFTMVGPSSTITTVAGDGKAGFSGDGGAATSAELDGPRGVAFDSSGDLFIADTWNFVVRELHRATGIISTVAGNGKGGFSGDGGPATAAELLQPEGVAVDSSGDLFIADGSGNDVREVNLATGIITTAAGNTTPEYSGDGGPATAAELSDPEGVAVDSSGDLFIADSANNVIRKVVLKTGIISTVAGSNANFSSLGDGGPATAAELTFPKGVAVDSSGNLFIADTFNNRIREVDHATRVITTVAGNGKSSFAGDGGLATAAELAAPFEVAVDSSGNLLIADTVNYRIREIDHATGVITTVAGNGGLGDGGPAIDAALDAPEGIACDPSGNLFIGDSLAGQQLFFNEGDDRVREMASGAALIDVTPAPLTIAADDKSIVYGAALPALTASYSGFVHGDTAASLTTSPTLSTTATPGSHVSGGAYSITASGAADPNYTITYVAGALRVTPAPLTIAADDQIKFYGAAVPALTASYSGFVNGDTAASLTKPPMLSTTATASSHIADGPYTITASGAVDADYAISYVAGSLTMNRAVLTIASDNKSKTYGAALPTFTASYSGFVNGDTADSLTVPPTFSTTATAASHVPRNPYTIAVSGAADPDYAISYVSGTLEITPASLIVVANDQSKVYGAALPTLTARYLGFVNGDSAASLRTQTTLSTTATVGSHVSGSPYSIVPSGAAGADYSISYVTGALKVTPAALTVAADDKTKVYGAPLPTLTASYSGFVNGDNSNVVSGAARLSTMATATSAVGGYPIAAALGTLSAADYAFTFTNGTLAITLSPPLDAKNAVYTIGSGAIHVSAANGVLANDSGPGQLSVTSGTVAGAEGGTFAFNADGSFTYTPPAHFPGFDYAKYSATDQAGDQGTATVSVLSQTGGVVWKFYESVLHRDPDYGGLQFWINDFLNGGKTGDIAVGFFESDELLNQIIGGYYQQYLGRTLDAKGLAYWEGVWHATGGPEGIKAGFAASPEFNDDAGNAHGDNPLGWLTALYQRILNRAPDAQGLDYWQRQLAAGESQHDIALRFFDSLEAYKNDATGWFEEYLGRAPSDAELNQFAGEMLGGKTDRDIEREITNLPEYGANPPASPPGEGVRLPDYLPRPTTTARQIATDALFARL